MTSNKKLTALAQKVIDKYLYDINSREGDPSNMVPVIDFSQNFLPEEEDNGPDTIPESFSPSSKVPPTQPSNTDLPNNLFSLVAKNAALAKKVEEAGARVYDTLTVFEEEAPTLTKEKLVNLHRKLSAVLAALNSIDL